ncbi:hypothetical protein PO909_011469 [Leuciscus waleckii]
MHVLLPWRSENGSREMLANHNDKLLDAAEKCGRVQILKACSETLDICSSFGCFFLCGSGQSTRSPPQPQSGSRYHGRTLNGVTSLFQRCSGPAKESTDVGGGPKATPAQRGFRDALKASQEPSAGVPEQQDGKRWGG